MRRRGRDSPHRAPGIDDFGDRMAPPWRGIASARRFSVPATAQASNPRC